MTTADPDRRPVDPDHGTLTDDELADAHGAGFFGKVGHYVGRPENNLPLVNDLAKAGKDFVDGVLARLR
jgi:hypothetical protein